MAVTTMHRHTGAIIGERLERQVDGFRACFGGEELQRAAAAMAGGAVGGTIKAYLATTAPPSLSQLSTFSASAQAALGASQPSVPTPAAAAAGVQDSQAGATSQPPSSSRLPADSLAHELMQAARMYQQLEDASTGRAASLARVTSEILPVEHCSMQAGARSESLTMPAGVPPPPQSAAVDTAMSVRPEQDFDLVYGHGLVLQELATRAAQGTVEQGSLLREACRQYQAAVRLRGSSHSAHYNWGVALSDLARLTQAADPDAARRCLELAAVRYADALHLHPDNPQALNNWGLVLQELAGQVKDKHERDQCLRQALAKFRHAVRVRPDFNRAAYNLGTVCYAAACSLQGELALAAPGSTPSAAASAASAAHAAAGRGGPSADASAQPHHASHPHPGDSAAVPSVQEVHDMQRRAVALESQARGLFSSAAQYILLAHTLQPHNEVYTKSLSVVKLLLPLPFLRAGYLTVPAPPGQAGPLLQWHRQWCVLDHVSLRCASSSENSLSGAGGPGAAQRGPQPHTGDADVASAALVLPLCEVSHARRVQDACLPSSAGLWVDAYSYTNGVYLVADTEDEADAWVDALQLSAYICSTRDASALAAALQPATR